jgi:hypothetical protein
MLTSQKIIDQPSPMLRLGKRDYELLNARNTG